MADFDLKDLGGLMEAAQRMQREMQRVQAELGNLKAEASSGGGMVTAVANGRLEVLSIHIDPSVVDPKDIGMLQDLVAAAVNQAIAKAKAQAEAELAKVTGGLGLPGMPTP